MENVCPLCKCRISNWMMASNKAEFIGKTLFHKSCLEDHKLRTGVDLRKEETKRV